MSDDRKYRHRGYTGDETVGLDGVERELDGRRLADGFDGGGERVGVAHERLRDAYCVLRIAYCVVRLAALPLWRIDVYDERNTQYAITWSSCS